MLAVTEQGDLEEGGAEAAGHLGHIEAVGAGGELPFLGLLSGFLEYLPYLELFSYSSEFEEEDSAWLH